MNQMDLNSVIDILETYRDKNKNSEYLDEIINELNLIYSEMDKYNRFNAMLTILPWDED